MTARKIFLLLVVLSGLAMACTRDEYEWTERDKTLLEIYNKAEISFHRQYGLKLIGRSISAFQGPIKRLGIALKVEADPSLEEAQCLLVGVTDEFLDLIHSNKNLIKYLSHPLLDVKDINVLIIFDHESLSHYQSPFISSIGLVDSKALIIFYESMENLDASEEILIPYAELEREFKGSAS